MHRALVSLGEELEAIDWYGQRIDATDDAELREILRHNRNEEIEHAAMLLEWIRRRDPDMEQRLKPRLFTSGSMVDVEDALEGDNVAAAADQNGNGAGKSATVGSLRTARKGT